MKWTNIIEYYIMIDLLSNKVSVSREKFVFHLHTQHSYFLANLINLKGKSTELAKIVNWYKRRPTSSGSSTANLRREIVFIPPEFIQSSHLGIYIGPCSAISGINQKPSLIPLETRLWNTKRRVVARRCSGACGRTRKKVVRGSSYSQWRRQSLYRIGK